MDKTCLPSPSPPSKEDRDYLPDVWDNQQRMSFMFSEFRPKEANPEGWESKMKFWQNTIKTWLQKTGRVSYTLDDVRNAFTRNGLRPDVDCLRLVASHLQREKIVMSHGDYVAQYSKSNQGLVTYAVSTFTGSLKWGISMLYPATESPDLIDETINSDSELVNMELVAEIGKKLVDEYNCKEVSCLKYDFIVKEVNDKMKITTRAMDLALMYLKSNGDVDIVVDNGIKIIKFGKNSKISEMDIGVMRLERAKEIVESELIKLEQGIDSCKDEARTCVKENNKSKAKLILKKKQRLEVQINKKEGQLDNIEYLLEQLTDADSHKAVINAYQKGAEALKLAQLKPEDIDNTVAEIETTLDNQYDVMGDIGRSFVNEFDDDAIEQELEEMLAADKKAAPIPSRTQTPKAATTSSDDQFNNLMDRLAALKDNKNIEVKGKKKEKSAPLFT